PEQEGGERNWDYRYTWIRDGSFSIYALLGLGYIEEAAAFSTWLRDRAAEGGGDTGRPLKIMYRVDGTSDLVEETLDHFEGWRRRPGRGHPRPVRRLARLAPGAHRQRRRRPAPARHLRRGPGLGLPGRLQRPGIGPSGLDRAGQHDGLAVRELGPARRGHLGN